MICNHDKECEQCWNHNHKLYTKYLRIRQAARVLNKVLSTRKYEERTKRYSELINVAEQLTFAAGKLVEKTDDFTWMRFNRKDYDELVAWRKEKNA